MYRRSFVAGVVAALALPRPARSQRAARVRRIGYLAPGSSPLKGFLEALARLDWVDDRNLVVEYRWARGQYEQLPALATELVRLNVEIIVAISTPAARAAKEASSAIPIVFVFASEPVATGLVDSLAHPGRNLTGVADVGVDLMAKRLELLKEVAPSVTTVAMLGNASSPLWDPIANAVQAAAHRLRLEIVATGVRTPDDLEPTFADISRRSRGLILVPDAMLYAERRRIASLAMRHRLPAVYDLSDFVEAGGLLSYGPSLVSQAQRAAVYIDKILRGRKPAELPVEQPTTFELVINMASAKSLDVTIPPALLLRASRVIE